MNGHRWTHLERARNEGKLYRFPVEIPPPRRTPQPSYHPPQLAPAVRIVVTSVWMTLCCCFIGGVLFAMALVYWRAR